VEFGFSLVLSHSGETLVCLQTGLPHILELSSSGQHRLLAEKINKSLKEAPCTVEGRVSTAAAVEAKAAFKEPFVTVSQHW
jgi:hypothetical protein